MTMRRRDFLVAAAGTAALAGTRSTSAMPTSENNPPKKKATLHLASQEGPMPGKTLEEKLDNMEKWGFVGLEASGRGLPDRVETIQKALRGRNVKLSTICAGFEGWLIADDPEIRKTAMTSIKTILTAAGELGAVGMIVVPAFNHQKSLPDREASVLLTGFKRWDEERKYDTTPLLFELAEHAHKCGTRVLLEPLNRKECYYMRTVAAASSLCKDVQHPGLAAMGDLWHMTWEETSDYGAFISGADYLHHVHIASRRRRKMPGEDGEADNYVNAFRALKKIGYQNYICLECGSVGDPMETVPAAAELIRTQWEMA